MASNIAYGFIGVEHLFNQRVTEVGVETVRDLIQQTTDAWNREVRAMLAGWVEETVVTKERVELPGSGTLQPLDETGWGNPVPTFESGFYEVGYPIQAGGDAWGTNRVSRRLMTLAEANRQTLATIRKDATWMRQHMLAAIFDNGEWNYEDKLLGNVTIKPLANNDSVVYLKNGETQPATAQHYLAQAEAISDAYNPFPTIYDLLDIYPANSGPYVVYIPTNLKNHVEALSEFTKVTDPDIDPSITRDRLRTSMDAAAALPGGRVFGKTDNCWIVEWRALPNNYMIGVSMGSGQFLRMRQWPDAALQGLYPELDDSDPNLNINAFLRYAGFGVYNRIGACVYQIGSASYSVPTGYNTPLP